MSLRSTPSVLIAALLVLTAGLSLTAADLHAQDAESAEVVVGTYQVQQVAQAVGLQQKMMQQMQGLQQRMETAQQAGDQAAMQQIQTEAQQIQQDVAAEFQTDVEAVMPQIAEETGATIIATDVTYTAPGVSTEDVTQAVIAAINGTTAPSGEEAGEAEAGE